MAAITFDTLKFANRLKSAGVASAHAEAEAEALAEVLELTVRDLVTREYLDFRLSQLEERMSQFEERMTTNMTQLEQRMNAGMTQLEQRITIRLGALMAGAVGIVAALVKLL